MAAPQHCPNRFKCCLLTGLVMLLVSATGALAQQAGTSPVKIFILAGQSNMQGQGEMSPAATPGTLEYIVENDPDDNYQFLLDGPGTWATLDDVWIQYERSGAEILAGSLAPGYGVNNGTIGPELGFGHVMGDHYENQVLLIKIAWGGKSLAVDFRPPSSGGSVGFYYNEIFRIVDDVTANLDMHFPDYDGGGHEIIGFGWHQGWNDRVTQEFNDEYEVNMVNFIRDIRSDLGIAGLPFVMATTGMSGWEETHPRALSLMEAQLAVAEYPEFQGNVFTVETRPFYKPASESPADQGYHWNRNAETMLNIGLAMGEAMIDLVHTRCPSGLQVSKDAGGIRLTWRNGEVTPASARILRNGEEIAAAAPVDPPTYLDAGATPGLLEYEVAFTMTEGEPCTGQSMSYNGCITDLAAQRSDSGIALSWTNNMAYEGIQITRDGEVIEGALPGDAEAYIDQSAPTGFLSYAVVPTNGTCEATTAIGNNSKVTVYDSGSGKAEGIVGSFTLTDSFNAAGADKLVVTVSVERDRGDPNTRIASVTYGGVDMIEAVQFKDSENYDPPGIGPAAIFYLDNPGEAGPIVVNGSAKLNGAQGSWLALLGTVEGVSVVSSSLGASTTIIPEAKAIVVAHNHVNQGPVPVADPPLTQLLSADNRYSEGAAGYLIVDDPGEEVIPTFSYGEGNMGNTPVTVAAAFELLDDVVQGTAFRRGDVNVDSKRDLADAITILTYLFSNGDDPACLDTADTNDDAKIDLADAVQLLSHLFSDLETLPAPFDTCGTDPTEDDLDCAEFQFCDN